jgi:hypothetical protein
MKLTVYTVLRTGGDFGREYVERIARGVERHLPGVDFRCLSDDSGVTGHMALDHDWPTWWSKLELFRPDLRGDILYLDLDTVICGGLSEIAGVGRLTVLRDFYHYFAHGRANGIGSGLMYLPEADRAAIWERWIADPSHWMAQCGQFGDQRFLELIGLRESAARWQDLVPGQVVSYKAHCRDQRPPDARLVCYHGKPRPHETGWAVDRAADHASNLPPEPPEA